MSTRQTLETPKSGGTPLTHNTLGKAHRGSPRPAPIDILRSLRYEQDAVERPSPPSTIDGIATSRRREAEVGGLRIAHNAVLLAGQGDDRGQIELPATIYRVDPPEYLAGAVCGKVIVSLGDVQIGPLACTNCLVRTGCLHELPNFALERQSVQATRPLVQARSFPRGQRQGDGGGIGGQRDYAEFRRLDAKAPPAKSPAAPTASDFSCP